MTWGMKLRLVGFVFAIAMLASLIVWAALTSSRRVEDARTQLVLAESESFRIAGRFQESVLGLDRLLLSLARNRDTNGWSGFENEWQALNAWLDRQHLSSPGEKEVLKQIDAAYDDYHNAAHQMEAKVRGSREAGLPVDELARI